MSIVSDDFETGTGHFVPWYGSPTVTHSTADAHTGTGSLSIVPGSSFYGVTQSTFNGYGGITAGQQYTASIWHKARVGTIGQHVMQVEWLDNTNTQISSVDTTFTPGASWAQVTATLTAPAGAVRINLGLLSNGTGDTATEWLADDFDISVAGGASLTGDVASTSTFGVSVAATRGANADAALIQTTGVTATARVDAATSGTIATALTVTTDATRTVHPDAALTSTVGTTIDATRGAVADQAATSTLAVTSAAALNAAASHAATSTLDVVATAAADLHATHTMPSTLTITIDADVTSPMAPVARGSWYGLLAIVRESAQTHSVYSRMRPVHCPQDGTVLINHPRAGGILHCQFCGYEPGGMDHP